MSRGYFWGLLVLQTLLFCSDFWVSPLAVADVSLTSCPSVLSSALSDSTACCLMSDTASWRAAGCPQPWRCSSSSPPASAALTAPGWSTTSTSFTMSTIEVRVGFICHVITFLGVWNLLGLSWRNNCGDWEGRCQGDKQDKSYSSLIIYVYCLFVTLSGKFITLFYFLFFMVLFSCHLHGEIMFKYYLYYKNFTNKFVIMRYKTH